MQNKNSNGTKICPRCRREINYYDSSCLYCGEVFEVEYPDERVKYIQKAVGTYLSKFDKIQSGDSASAWNWCAFLFTYSWLAYRKMYKLAIISLVCISVVDSVLGNILFSVINNDSVADLLNNFVVLIVCAIIGIKGDIWYKKKIDVLVEESVGLSTEEKQQHYKKGGTSVLAVIIFALVVGAINVLI